MSQKIADLLRENPGAKTREQMLALVPDVVYDDGRTKQCFKDDCDIDKIMTRFSQTGTISHLTKWEGVYADFSDFDFQEQTQMLTRGREIFDDLPAELRQEFGQSPARFFAYVNDPANVPDLAKKLKALARPGQQLPQTSPADADTEAALAAQNAATVAPVKAAIVPPKGSQEVKKPPG